MPDYGCLSGKFSPINNLSAYLTWGSSSDSQLYDDGEEYKGCSVASGRVCWEVTGGKWFTTAANAARDMTPEPPEFSDDLPNNLAEELLTGLLNFVWN
jgi:hypothetical protein